MAIAAGASLGLGILQSGLSLAALSKLSKTPYEDYSVSPELQKSYGRAEEMSLRGYTPEETAAFRQNLAGTSAQRYQRATDMAGGNLSQAIQGGINYGNIKGLVNFAADDASLHRKNIQYADNLARAIQTQKNLIQQEKMRRRYMQEQAYGGALKAGTENIANSLNLSQALDYYKGLNNDTGIGGAGTSATGNFTPYKPGGFSDFISGWIGADNIGGRKYGFGGDYGNNYTGDIYDALGDLTRPSIIPRENF